MPDPRFYTRAGPFKLADLAGRIGARLAPSADAALDIRDIGNIDGASKHEIVYFSDPAFGIALANSNCGACVTTEQLSTHVPKCSVLLVDDPRAAFAEIATLFYPAPYSSAQGQSERIALDAKLGKDVCIAPGAVVGAGAVIGPGTRIGANAVIGPSVIIGDNCHIGANTTLAFCLVGNNVVVHPGVQIGQDGFGFVPGKAGHKKVPQLGRVIIHDNVEIGANTTIDRGAIGDTVIGTGTKIDNLVQIAHNVVVGAHCLIVSQAGLAGSCKIGDGVIIGGQVGVTAHVRVGEGAQIAGKTGVMRDIGPGEVVMGYPAKPIREFWRDFAALSRLTKRDK